MIGTANVLLGYAHSTAVGMFLSMQYAMMECAKDTKRITNLNRSSTPSALCTSPRPPCTLAPNILLTTLEPPPTYSTYSLCSLHSDID